MSDGSWMQDAVRAFHRAMGQPAPDRHDPAVFRPELRARLLLEEAAETAQALGFDLRVEAENGEEPSIYLTRVAEPDWPEVVDGLCDLAYVTLGTAVEGGFSLGTFFHEVHRSNMTKLSPETGKPVIRQSDGKVLKPPTFEPPRIAELWRRVLRRSES